MSAGTKVKVERTHVNGFSVDMFTLNDMMVGVATEIGPRVLYLASSKRPRFNLFSVLPDAGVQTPIGFWKIFGGHRLWSSPESMPRSYSMDDKPIEITVKDAHITIHGNPEIDNLLQKTITIKPFSGDGVQVIHSIRNIGRWPIQLSCWALSVMRSEGFAIIPLKPFKRDKEGLLPDRHVTFWPYTNPSDERLRLENEYIFLTQNPEAQTPIKIGTTANPSWTAYWVDGSLFVKNFSLEPGAYPDFGCTVEAYANSEMLELETVGPLTKLDPSESVTHIEIWKIFDVGEVLPKSESVKKSIEPLIDNK